MTTRGCLAAALCLLASACALTGPPIEPPTDPNAPPALSLTIIEGQPRGSLLQLEDNEPTGRLALLRRADDEAAFGVHYRFDAKGPLQFLDAAVEPGRTYEYAAVRLDGDDVLATSAPVTVRWLAPPAPPLTPAATALGRHVELTWSGCEACGAVVFRRTLGEKRYRRLPRAAPAGQARFVNQPDRRGAIYGYTVSHVLWSGAVPILGPTCAEVYVESMPAGPLLRDDPVPEYDGPGSSLDAGQ